MDRVVAAELARLARKFDIGSLRRVHRSRLPWTSCPVVMSAAVGLLIGAPLYVLGWEFLAIVVLDVGVAGAVIFAYRGETGEPGGRHWFGVCDGGLVVVAGGGQPIVLPWASITGLESGDGSRGRRTYTLTGVRDDEPVTVHIGAVSDRRGLLGAIADRRPQPRPTRLYASAGVVAVVAVSVALVALPNPFIEEVVPVPRSTLSTEMPPVQAAQLIDALPKPADFGPGWEFDVDSLGGEDKIAEFARGELYPKLCEWADPAKAGISTADAAEVISGRFRSPANDGGVLVSVVVDPPARTAERFSYLRRVGRKCTEITIASGGEEYTRTITTLPDPDVGADESLALTFADEGGSFPSSGKLACARTGGLAICLEGADFPDDALPASLARARTALGD